MQVEIQNQQVERDQEGDDEKNFSLGIEFSGGKQEEKQGMREIGRLRKGQKEVRNAAGKKVFDSYLRFFTQGEFQNRGGQEKRQGIGEGVGRERSRLMERHGRQREQGE